MPETNLLFVGITRATKWVFLSSQRGRELPIIEALRPLEAGGNLTTQTRRDRFRGGPQVPRLGPQAPPPGPAEEGIGDLL
jgi:hypothetical protein